MEQRLIDANCLLTEKMKTKYYHLKNGDIAIPIIDIEHAPTVEAISKKDLQKAINKINKCSLGKWYVGRTDGKSEEVVLLEDVLNILTDLLNKGANNENN